MTFDANITDEKNKITQQQYQIPFGLFFELKHISGEYIIIPI
jgi:hypothetical protein